MAARSSSNNENQKFGREFLDQMMDFIAENFEPEDIFTETRLRECAEEMGYVLREDE